MYWYVCMQIHVYLNAGECWGVCMAVNMFAHMCLHIYVRVSFSHSLTTALRVSPLMDPTDPVQYCACACTHVTVYGEFVLFLFIEHFFNAYTGRRRNREND